MYALFTLLAGACQSAMGSLNRMLTDYVGMFGMSLVVHAVGGILLLLYMKLYCHEKLKILSGCHFQLLYRSSWSFCNDLSFSYRTACDLCSDRPLRLVWSP